MLKARVIRPSHSDWTSPIVLASKKDGETRFCVDFRRLNEVTRKDAFPLPLISDLLDKFAAARYFTSLDLRTGFWQIRMKQEDAAKTAFLTRQGLYEFTVMPYGLTNAPATFQRLMNQVLAGLLWNGVVVYIDDINI